MNEEHEPDRKGRDGWLKVLVGGVIVAIVTGTLPLVGAYFSEDIARCELATDFLVGFEDGTPYTEEEMNRLKAVFIRLAEAHCKGG